MNKEEGLALYGTPHILYGFIKSSGGTLSVTVEDIQTILSSSSRDISPALAYSSMHRLRTLGLIVVKKTGNNRSGFHYEISLSDKELDDDLLRSHNTKMVKNALKLKGGVLSGFLGELAEATGVREESYRGKGSKIKGLETALKYLKRMGLITIIRNGDFVKITNNKANKADTLVKKKAKAQTIDEIKQSIGFSRIAL